MKKLVVRFLQRWLVDTIAVFAALAVPGIKVDSWSHLILASLVLGIVNTFIRPILMLLTLPLIFVTLGLFIFVINALMLLLVNRIIPGFEVSGMWPALGGALIITAVTILLERITGKGNSSNSANRRSRSTDHRGPPPGAGPVIDV
jgi:putative membrane protein